MTLVMKKANESLEGTDIRDQLLGFDDKRNPWHEVFSFAISVLEDIRRDSPHPVWP